MQPGTPVYRIPVPGYGTYVHALYTTTVVPMVRQSNHSDERRAMQMSQTATPNPLGSENAATDELTISTAIGPKNGTRLNPLGSSCHHSPFCARARAQSGAGRMI